jgi:CelD/BcsL family acetyltransferase involved in cellulose biosynthesis
MSDPPGATRKPGPTVEVLDIGDDQWARFVSAHPRATCFHRPEWVRLIADCYRYPAFALVQRDPAGMIEAGLPLIEVRLPTRPRRWLALPFSDECGPLVRAGGSAADFLRQADMLRSAQGVADLQVRADVDLGPARTVQVGVTHALALRPAGDPAPPRARASVRRHIAAAQRAGVQVRYGEAVQDVEHFYRLHAQTRRRQGVPVQPRRYFRMLWERMIEPGHGVVVLASTGAAVVAGAVYLHGGGTVTYKYGASDQRYWSLRPNHAVMAFAIAWAVERGCSSFDFGRTDLGNEGLMRFKASWGAAPRPLRYTSSAGGGGAGAGRTLQATMAPVIRRSPAFVCRGLGELLYRYAA